ncbi:MAG TPA: glycosyltransferase family 39 protein [Spirochaetia bacterium]|nr:glycosyltransferase family 39 protein [Spirochaetia bacterium]
MKKIWQFISRFKVEILLIILLVPSIFSLLQPGYFTMHDDLQSFRLYELNKCFQDGQFPCRWVPDAGYGYGYPLMQFYPPMPYYPMQIMVFLGLGFFWPIKIMFALAFVLSGVGMYYLAREFFGKWGGVLSALFYVYAPYHSVDVYVRGAQNEAWGMVWFPFVLLFIYELIAKKFSWKSFLLFAVALMGQLTSHNVMTMIFAPTAIIWALFWIWRTKNIKAIKTLVISGLLGLGLSAFFFLPVVLEQKFVHVDSMMSGYFNYMAHYADINQMFFSRFWGYGGSTWGPDDGMSFSIGQLQWIVALIASVIAIFRLKNHKTSSLMILMSVFFGFIYAFLCHSRSLPVWQRISLLQYSQFPWRLVALIVFYFSFTAGYLATIKVPNLFKKLIIILLSVGVIVWNMPFFRVERPTRVSFEEKMAGRQWELQVTGGIFDYLPKSAPTPPGEPAFTIPVFNEGRGGILNYSSGTNWLSFDANVSSPSAKIMLPLFSFPGLVTKVDNRIVTTIADPDLGRVIVDVPFGIHTVYAKIGYTPIRLGSDIITLISIIILIRLTIYARRQR